MRSQLLMINKPRYKPVKVRTLSDLSLQKAASEDAKSYYSKGRIYSANNTIEVNYSGSVSLSGEQLPAEAVR